VLDDGAVHGVLVARRAAGRRGFRDEGLEDGVLQGRALAPRASMGEGNATVTYDDGGVPVLSLWVLVELDGAEGRLAGLRELVLISSTRIDSRWVGTGWGTAWAGQSYIVGDLLQSREGDGLGHASVRRKLSVGAPVMERGVLPRTGVEVGVAILCVMNTEQRSEGGGSKVFEVVKTKRFGYEGGKY
jgi:hypothetical protein